MKILVITTSYPISHDGSEAAGSFVYDFINALEKQCESAIVYPVNDESFLNETRENHFPFPVSDLPLSNLSPSNPFNWLKILKVLIHGQSKVNEATQLFKPDHILALWTLPSGYWAKKAGEKYSIPYSTWSLGSDIWSLARIPVIKNYLKKVLINAENCFSDGYQLMTDVENLSNRQACFLPSTRSLTNISNKELKTEPPYNVAFLGRWHKNKGIDLLIQAIELLDDSSWGKIRKIKIAGGGNLENLVKENIKTIQDSGNPVELYGYLDTEKATELLLWADYLVIPSRIESIPVIYSDALQCMTPMVVTPVGDFPLLFSENPPGIIAKSVTASSLKDSIMKILDTSPSQYREALVDAKNIFNIDTTVNTFLLKLNEN